MLGAPKSEHVALQPAAALLWLLHLSSSQALLRYSACRPLIILLHSVRQLARIDLGFALVLPLTSRVNLGNLLNC